MPQIEKKTMSLPVKLTDEEVRLRGVELAAVTQEINKVDAQRKEVAKEYKDKLLDGLAEKRDTLARAVETREELRPVEVYEVPNLGDATATIYRADTRERVQSRALSEYEIRKLEEEARQPRLPLGKKAAEEEGEEESTH
jgi:hypothetical protein